jgi:hypothetical protein
MDMNNQQPAGIWSLRPCMSCGALVKCEPRYPDAAYVVCSTCIGWHISRQANDPSRRLWHE